MDGLEERVLAPSHSNQQNPAETLARRLFSVPQQRSWGESEGITVGVTPESHLLPVFRDQNHCQGQTVPAGSLWARWMSLFLLLCPQEVGGRALKLSLVVEQKSSASLTTFARKGRWNRPHSPLTSQDAASDVHSSTQKSSASTTLLQPLFPFTHSCPGEVEWHSK